MESKIIAIAEIFLWGKRYRIWKSIINVRNNHRAERVFIKEIKNPSKYNLRIYNEQWRLYNFWNENSNFKIEKFQH